LPDDLITKCITYDKIKPVISVRAFNENYLKLLSKKSTKFKTDVQEFFKNSQCTDFSNAGQISSIMQQEKNYMDKIIYANVVFSTFIKKVFFITNRVQINEKKWNF